MTPAQISGHARLILRLPHWRDALNRASGQSFLDLCEAYDTACNGLAHWLSSEDPRRGEHIIDYQQRVRSLEFEAMMSVMAANKKRETS